MSKFLSSEYIPQNRPYSSKELNNTLNSIYNDNKLSKTIAFHPTCKHKYYVKKNGKKEHEINVNNEVGNCSVCYKLKKTDNKQKNIALNLVDEYDKFVNSSNPKLTYDTCDLVSMFYGWLYEN